MSNAIFRKVKGHYELHRGHPAKAPNVDGFDGPGNDSPAETKTITM